MIVAFAHGRIEKTEQNNTYLIYVENQISPIEFTIDENEEAPSYGTVVGEPYTQIVLDNNKAISKIFLKNTRILKTPKKTRKKGEE